MRKKKFIPTKHKRLEDKQSVDMLTIQLMMMIDELHKHKDSVSLSDVIKQI